jgi:hypothetical protein
MHKKILLLCLISTTFLFAGNIAKKDMLKASIVKLIEKTSRLEKRVTLLEKELLQKSKDIKKIVYLPNARKYKEMDVKDPLFFIPQNKSFIRTLPYPKADKVGIAINSEQYKVTQLACYKKIGFWGKTQSGWIYISNSKYGKLVDNQGNFLPNNYQYWCK